MTWFRWVCKQVHNGTSANIEVSTVQHPWAVITGGASVIRQQIPGV